MTTATMQLEYLTREQACEQLGLKDRRLRDYLAAGAIRQSVDGLLHPGDVAKLVAERQGKRANAQQRAAATMTQSHTRGPMAVRQGQDGKTAPKQLPSGKTAIADAPAVRQFDSMPACVRLTIKEAAAYLRLPATFVRSLVDSGALPHCQVPCGGKADYRVVVKKADLDLFP